MNREDLFSFLLNDIMEFESINDDDIRDNINDALIEDAVSALIEKITSNNLKKFLTIIKHKWSQYQTDSILHDDYTLMGSPQLIDFDDPAIKSFKRSVIFSDPSFKCMVLDTIYDNGILIDLSLQINIDKWDILEHYFVISYNIDSSSIKKIIELIANAQVNRGIFINLTATSVDVVKALLFCYLSCLKDSKPVQPLPDLNITSATIAGTLNYDNTFEYNQYMEVYDILNEVVIAKDILSRFLKVYHVLEYLSYRCILVDLVSNTRNKTFMLEIMKLANSIRNEKETIIHKLSLFFDADKVRVNSVLSKHKTQGIKNYALQYWKIDNLNFNDMKIFSTLIYSIRCNIVHSKDSELHFTLSNPDDYRLIIPMMKDILSLVEEIIVKKVSQISPQIHYPNKVIEVYK